MTSVYSDVLQAVVQLLADAGVTAVIGALPPNNGFSVAYASGGTDETYLNKNTSASMTLVFNGKNKNQQTVAQTMDAAHGALTRTKVYPQSTAFQITNISTVNAPNYIGREENNQWLYGSSLRVKFFYRGD